MHWPLLNTGTLEKFPLVIDPVPRRNAQWGRNNRYPTLADFSARLGRPVQNHRCRTELLNVVISAVLCTLYCTLYMYSQLFAPT